MVYTITFNPAVDVVISVGDIELGGINRTMSQEIYYAGKGINVSYVLYNMGRANTMWGFLAGHIGSAIEEALTEAGLTCDFIRLPAGETRINTKMRVFDDEGSFEETALNAPGPAIDEASLEKLFGQLGTTQDGDVLIVSGAVPANLPEDTYARILNSQAGKNVRVVVDATGDLLMKSLPYGPFLVKPNDEELAEIMDGDPEDYNMLLAGARKLHDEGAVNVLVSRGGKGAILLDEFGELHDMPALKGELVNSVGAGDSTVAGFVHGYLSAIEEGAEGSAIYDRAFATAMACGAATAFSEGLAERMKIEELLAQIG